MNLLDWVRRDPAPDGSWTKIPWDDPMFSRRMLAEHLSQAHDAASRRFAIIDQHVAWIHAVLLGGRPARVLDLGCGPGFYTNRLAVRGHTCTGIDFAPASIAYARRQAASAHLTSAYIPDDLRTADFGTGFDLVMLIYGELNAFARSEAEALLTKARSALAAGGTLLLEVSTAAALRTRGTRPPSWYAAEHGLFSDAPYVCLSASAWDDAHAIATERYDIIDAATAAVTSYAVMTQAYTPAQYRQLLTECGFSAILMHPTFGEAATPDFTVITARA